MKITRIVVHTHSEPKTHPVRDALQVLDRNGNVHLTIETDEGITGESDTYFGRVEGSPEVLALLIERELAPEVVGRDPFLIRVIRDRLWKLTDYHGSTGLATFGIAAIDLALWDLVGRALGQPVWRLLGAARDAVPAYAMVGWLELDLPDLAAACAKATAQGFRGVKMKVGAPTLGEDLVRVAMVREAIGPDAALMVDANQALSVSEALRRGREFERLGCTWFEEPIRADNIEGHSVLSRKLDIPIASGENRYGIGQFRDLLVHGRIGIVQPDLRRAGGLTECLEIGHFAHGLGIPYASHGGGAHLHLLAALPNTMYMESGFLPDDGSIALIDGCFPLPTAPGLSGHR